jgi:hypothetical protein
LLAPLAGEVIFSRSHEKPETRENPDPAAENDRAIAIPLAAGKTHHPLEENPS